VFSVFIRVQFLPGIFYGESQIYQNTNDQYAAQRQPELVVPFLAEQRVEDDARDVTRRPADEGLKSDLLEHVL